MRPISKSRPSSFKTRCQALIIKTRDWIRDHNAQFDSANRSKKIKGGAISSALMLVNAFLKALKEKKVKEDGSFEMSYSMFMDLYDGYFEMTYTGFFNDTDGVDAVKRHFKKFKECGLIKEIIKTHPVKKRGNFHVRLADWVVDDMKDLIPTSPTSSSL